MPGKNTVKKNTKVRRVDKPVNNVHKDTNTKLMGTINETLQLIRRTTTATHSIEVGDMVSG
jgi:hypothetical protein